MGNSLDLRYTHTILQAFQAACGFNTSQAARKLLQWRENFLMFADLSPNLKIA